MCLVLCGSISGLAQKGETQDEHDKQIKADTERNTKYHNNADDYPAATPRTPVPRNAPAPVNAVDVHSVYEMADSLARQREQDFQKAYSAAQGPDEAAKMTLAQYYLEGHGTPVNKEAAMAVYTSIANLGPMQAYRVGVLLSGPGPAADNVEAYRNMKKAAEGGVGEAKTWIATHAEPVRHAGELPSMLTFVDDVFRMRGAGVQPTSAAADEKLVNEWTAAKAARYTNFKKMGKLGREALDRGKANLYGVGVPVDLKRAQELLSMAGDVEYLGWVQWAALVKSGSRDFSALGTAVNSQDYMHSPELEYLRAVYACAMGDRYRQRALLELSTGRFVKSEFPQAKADLAVMKLEGVGGPLDEKAGMADLNGAADEGNHNAQYMLGLIYERGLHGVAKDPARAAKLFQTAASTGQLDAAKHLTQVGMAKP